MKMRVVVNLAL